MIFINDLPVGIISLCEIFADDTPLFSKVYDTDISAKELNSNLEKNSQWALQWKIQFNPDPICKQSYFFLEKQKKPHPTLSSSQAFGDCFRFKTTL